MNKKIYEKPIAEKFDTYEEYEMLITSGSHYEGGEDTPIDDGCSCGCCGPWEAYDNCYGCPGCRHDNSTNHKCH